MDLSGLAVFLDFDGTIAVDDTGVYLLERLAPLSWRELEDRYTAGSIGSRECMAAEWALLPRDRQRVEAVASEVPIDAGFRPLVAFLLRSGAEVCILSDGFGFRADEVGAEAGIDVVTNSIDWDTWTVRHPNEVADCECAECGACKREPIRRAAARGRTTVLVGDGTSDVKAASVADVVFAKAELAAWCEAQGVSFERFSGLGDVEGTLRSWAQAQAPTGGAQPGRGMRQNGWPAGSA